MPEYVVDRPQVNAYPQGASSPQEAGVVRMNAANHAQNNANQKLAGGKKGGGGIEAPVVRTSYTETSAGNQGVQAQTNNNVKSSVQNQEFSSLDKGAFKKGGKRRNKSRKTSKRKIKRRRTRKYRK
jgi:hypothetical protein